MSSLNQHISSLLAAVTEAMEAANPPLVTSETVLNAKDSKRRWQSLELSLPITANPNPMDAPKRHESRLTECLRVHTFSELAAVMFSEQLPKPELERLQKAIEDGRIKVQLLLAQEEIDVDQVLRDYAQSVLAIAYDALRPKQRNRISSMNSASDFEQMTALLVARLRTHCQLPNANHPQQKVSLRLDTAQLKDTPAPPFSCVKLVFVLQDPAPPLT